MPFALAAVRTLLTALILSTYVLVLGPPAILWTLITRNGRFIYGAGALGVRISFAIAGIRVRVLGGEHILRGHAAVYAANHTSNLEPPALFIALRGLHPRLRVLYKAEMRRIPMLVWVFDAGGFVPIERGDRDRSHAAVDRASQALREGASFLIFPEGTRSRTGELLPFKKGGIIMAINAQVPIVPVAVSGAGAAMRKGSPLIWPATITVEFAPPVATAGLTFERRDEVVSAVRAAIEARRPVC